MMSYRRRYKSFRPHAGIRLRIPKSPEVGKADRYYPNLMAGLGSPCNSNNWTLSRRWTLGWSIGRLCTANSTDLFSYLTSAESSGLKFNFSLNNQMLNYLIKLVVRDRKKNISEDIDICHFLIKLISILFWRTFNVKLFKVQREIIFKC